MLPFFQITQGERDFVLAADVKNALDLAGYKLPNHQVRDLLADLKVAGKIGEDNRVNREVFKEVSECSPVATLCQRSPYLFDLLPDL